MDYEIAGDNFQSLKIILDAGEAVHADSGKLISKDENVIMTPRVMGGIVGMLERKAVGASALLTEFRAHDKGGHMEIAGVFPGKIMSIPLKEGEKFIAEHDAFLMHTDGMKFTITTVSIGAAFFGGAGLLLQEFTGPGTVFIHTAGDNIVYNLDGDRAIELEPGHIAAFDYGISYKIRFVDNIRTALWGGTGLFLATFSGKGRVITHSISRYKLAATIYNEGLKQATGK
jgi:uncharacterized protein (TIGR00266 family)